MPGTITKSSEHLRLLGPKSCGRPLCSAAALACAIRKHRVCCTSTLCAGEYVLRGSCSSGPGWWLMNSWSVLMAAGPSSRSKSRRSDPCCMSPRLGDPRSRARSCRSCMPAQLRTRARSCRASAPRAARAHAQAGSASRGVRFSGVRYLLAQLPQRALEDQLAQLPQRALEDKLAPSMTRAGKPDRLSSLSARLSSPFFARKSTARGGRQGSAAAAGCQDAEAVLWRRRRRARTPRLLLRRRRRPRTPRLCCGGDGGARRLRTPRLCCCGGGGGKDAKAAAVAAAAAARTPRLCCGGGGGGGGGQGDGCAGPLARWAAPRSAHERGFRSAGSAFGVPARLC
jgi:hypothetical protein